MAKNCSGCNTKHLPPFGSRCSKMAAVVEGYDRKDETYLKFLEDEYCRCQKEDELRAKGLIAPVHVDDPSTTPPAPDLSHIEKSLHEITDRLGKLEVKTDDTSEAVAGTAMSTADLLATPLTAALAKLLGHEEERGRQLRPENYAQACLKDKQRDYTKLDTIDLFYGWLCVLDHLLSTGGDIHSYIGHIKYTTEMLQSRKFFDIGAASYDRLIVDKYLASKSGGFNPDPILSSLTFSTQVIPDSTEICHGGSLTKGVSSYVNKNPRRRRGAFQGKKFQRIFQQTFASTTTIASAIMTSVLKLILVGNVMPSTEQILVVKGQKSLENFLPC